MKKIKVCVCNCSAIPHIYSYIIMVQKGQTKYDLVAKRRRHKGTHGTGRKKVVSVMQFEFDPFGQKQRRFGTVIEKSAGNRKMVKKWS